MTSSVDRGRGARPGRQRRPRLVARLVTTLVSLVLLSGLVAAPAAAADPPSGGYTIPKPVLAAGSREVLRGGLGLVAADVRAGRKADLGGMVVRDRNGRPEVAVNVQVLPGTTSRVTSALRRTRATVTNTSEAAIEGYLPLTGLDAAAAIDGVRSISPIYRRLHGSFVTPAINLYGTREWHAAGFDGSGIRVGVIDGGFDGVRRLLGEEIPKNVIARCFAGVGSFSTDLADCENGVDHGTAVAELVVDMAPGAQLYIANPESPIDYRDTIRWMTAQGVRVINSSAASGYLFDGPGDGTAGRPDSTYEEVDLAVALGAFWVNSAGNEGDAGWTGAWLDADDDDTMEWAPGDETNTLRLEVGQQVRVAMRWPDDWGAASNDYDIALFRGDTAVAAGSDFQDGEGDPYEVFEFEAPTSADYDLVVRRYDADPAERIQILIYASGSLDMEHRVEAGTLPSPADSANPGMVTVGAVQLNTPDVIETYSSRGPTVDGRVKPDLVAADCMATATYGLFCGTSASAPLTTGAAVLALEANPTFEPDELAAHLRTAAVPLGDPVPNSTFGSGRLRLGTPSTAVPGTTAIGLRSDAASVTWPAEVSLTATLTPPIPAGRRVHFQASSDGVEWVSVGSAETADGRTATLTISPLATRRYRAMALGTAITSPKVTVVVHQRLTVRPSVAPAAAGRAVKVLRAGDVVTFESLVRPARADLPRAVVEYTVYQRVGGTWVLDRRVEVTADGAGTARMPLHFDVPGQWYVRARALATSGTAASGWSPTFRYDVAGTAAGTLQRSWHAALTGGSGTLSSYSNGTSILALNVTGLPRSRAVAVEIHRDACGDGGPRVTTLRTVRTAANGSLAASVRLSAAQLAAIARASSAAGTLSLVLRSGSVARCATFVSRPLVVSRIATGEESSAVTTDGAAVWVTNIFDDSVSRIDPATNVVTATIPVPGYPAGVASDGAFVWVTHISSGLLTKIDAHTLEIVDTLMLGALPGNLVVGGGFVWVVLEGEDTIVKIDPGTDEILDAIPVAADPYGIAYVDGAVWVTSPADGIVTRIDPLTDEVATQIEVPDVVDVGASGDLVWVSVQPARSSAGAIVRIDPDTNEIVARVTVGFDPSGIAIVGDTAYVAMTGEPTLVQVRGDRVIARVPVGMKSLSVVPGFGSLWLLHPYGSGIAGSGLFDGGVSRVNI